MINYEKETPPYEHKKSHVIPQSGRHWGKSYQSSDYFPDYNNNVQCEYVFPCVRSVVQEAKRIHLGLSWGRAYLGCNTGSQTDTDNCFSYNNRRLEPAELLRWQVLQNS